MPAPKDANLKRPVLPPAVVTAIRYNRDKREQLEGLNGEATLVTRGHIAGITDAQSFILEAVAEQAATPTAVRAVIPASLVGAIALIRRKRTVLERGEADETSEGLIVGLTEALALILEASVDEAHNPMSPL